jgi:hypothetical protein
MPFLTALSLMASGRDHSKHPWGRGGMIAINCRPIEQGRMSSLAGHRHRPGGVLLYVGDCLGLLLVMALISTC